MENFINFGGYRYPKWPLFGQKLVLMGQKWSSMNFFFLNIMFDTKTNLLTFENDKSGPKNSKKNIEIAKKMALRFWKTFLALMKVYAWIFC